MGNLLWLVLIVCLIVLILSGMFALLAEFPYVYLVIPIGLITWFALWLRKTWKKGERGSFWAGFITGVYYLTLISIFVIVTISAKNAGEYEMNQTASIALPLFLYLCFVGLIIFPLVEEKLEKK